MSLKELSTRKCLLFALLLSLLYTKILFFPFVNYLVQPFEIIFLISLGIGIIRKYPRPSIPKLSYLFLAFSLLHLLIHLKVGVALEFIRTVYLMSFLVWISWLFKEVNINLRLVFSIGIILLIANAIIAGLLYFYGSIVTYVYVYLGYPYLGDVVRTQGFNATPSQMSSLAAIPLVYHFFVKKINLWLIIGLLMVLLSTLSKELAPLFAVIGVFLLLKNKWLRYLGLLAIIFGTVTLTFFVIASQLPAIIRPNVMDPNPFFCSGNWCAYPTPYFHLFRAAIQGFLENPVSGLGMGRFYEYTLLLKETGFYPKNIASVECHDIYWGNMAQFGILYLPVFTGFIFFIKSRIQKIKNQKFQFFFTVLCTYYLIEGLIISNIHFRHIWVVLGFLILVSENKKKNITLSTTP